jgi:hypothetical protein
MSFIQDRDDALRSLDKDTILAYMKKYNIDWIPSTEEVFWAGIHKSRLAINSFSKEEKKISMDWLTKHGYKHDISM